MRTISSVLTFEEQKEEENRSRINLIEANGKSGNEGKLSELFILNFWHPTFRYLLRYEYLVEGKRADLGAGDIVFGSYRDSDQELRTVPRQVLIIEAKYINLIDGGKTVRKRRTEHRKKVSEQVIKYMKDWKYRNPNDEVYGAILMNEMCSVLGSLEICDQTYLSNKISEMSVIKHESSPPDVTGEIDDETDSLELKFHPPLPNHMWSNNSKSHMDIDLWTAIKNYEFSKKKYSCEMCGTEGNDSNLTLHQRWEFDLPKIEVSKVTKTEEVKAKFVTFDVVCVACHDLLHIGRARLDGKEKQMFEHLQTKSGRQYIELEIEYTLAWCEYQLAKDYTCWKVSEDEILAHPMVQKWLKCDKRRTIGRFGNLCCLQNFNPVLRVDKKENHVFRTINVGTTTTTD